MARLNLDELLTLDKASQKAALAVVNAQLEEMTAEQRVDWAATELGDKLVLSSSFGIQAAVCLHLLTQFKPDIPVILTDTGYLFPETYQFIDELTQQLSLNLQIYTAPQ